MSRASEQQHDLIVVGGGLTGLALADAVAGAGYRVLVVERSPLADLVAAPYDGRSTAIALGARRFLAAIGVWPFMADEAEPIHDIVVREGFSPIEVHYDHREVGDEPLGFIVENRAIRKALLGRARALPSLVIAAPVQVAELELGDTKVRILLEDGTSATAPLVALCEGRLSTTREKVGIAARRWAYGQTGIVCTIRHEKPHHGLAVERFFPDGPFARLPMTGNRSSIVWALEEEAAKIVMALDDVAFLGEIAERFGDDLGALALEGPRWAYPLVLVLAERYTGKRLVLVGDAARGIHPIAGQGWNLALRDVAAVAEILVDRLRLGLDPGDELSLERYAAWRRFDGLALVAVTDGINRLFANDIFPIRLAREAGLAIVERIPPMKRFFMRHAMGLIGDLPRTMRGEAL
ncbi:UbiH/UbiF/VisC/COQ6 family ubiquinone biosynthesis hydroxylase [Benzoatithermus flavus]|uniref:UbiH/UbiF/VisC/COQ6 family ubiquinone biosynthesis hydroxylase n=1 Tax=Benzoatithermus flavus TaxID=3108223 RepID=A0ABU8XNH3_9PROT